MQVALFESLVPLRQDRLLVEQRGSNWSLLVSKQEGFVATLPLLPIPRIRLIQHAHEGLELQRADVAHVSGEIVDLAQRLLAHLFRHMHEA